MSWHKLDTKQQEALVNERLSDFIKNPDNYGTYSKEAWRIAVDDANAEIMRLVINRYKLDWEEFCDRIRLASIFRVKCAEYLEQQLS